jgi:choice-of-anchor A domain-containing protein
VQQGIFPELKCCQGAAVPANVAPADRKFGGSGEAQAASALSCPSPSAVPRAGRMTDRRPSPDRTPEADLSPLRSSRNDAGARYPAARHRRLRRPRHVVPLLLVLLTASGARAQHEQSMDAFVPAAHKTVFEMYNLLALGNLNLAKSSVEGRVGVSGQAELVEFEFNKAHKCDKYTPAVVVQGALHASMGSINNGYTIVGRSSRISHNVRMSCSSRVETYNAEAQKIQSFEEHRQSLIRESGDVCANPTSGEVRVDEEKKVMQLVPGNSTYSCYAVFKTSTEALASVNRLEYAGTDLDRNVLINVSGKFATLRDFAMVGFNPQRTLMTFCGIQGHVELYNNRLHCSLFAPTTEFTVMGTVVNGSMITGDLRGKIVLLNQPYMTC